MILYIAISTIVLLCGLYELLGSWAYRHPRALLLTGIVAAALGSMLKSTPIMLKGFPNLALRPEELDIATLIVDPLLGGFAGGLVASAVIIKLQIMHAKAQIAADEQYQFASEVLDQARLNFQQVRDAEGSIPSSEFAEKYSRVFDGLCRALDSKSDAEKRISAVFVPGLGDSKHARSKRPRA